MAEEEFRSSLTHVLEQLSVFGNAIQAKSSKLMRENENNTELDMNSMQAIALSLVKMLRKIKGNNFALLTVVESYIEQLNASHQSDLFQEVIKKIHECKTCTVIVENGRTQFSQPVDKAVMVNLGRNGRPANLSDEAMLNLDTSHNQHADKEIIIDLDEIEAESDSRSVDAKIFNMSLRKKGGSCDTEDTDDAWQDTLSRNSVKKEIKSEDVSPTNLGSNSLNIEPEVVQYSEEADKDGPIDGSNAKNTNDSSTSYLDVAVPVLVPDVNAEPSTAHMSTESFSIEADNDEDDRLIASQDYVPEECEMEMDLVADTHAQSLDDDDDASSIWSTETVVVDRGKVHKLDDCDGNCNCFCPICME